MGTLEQNQVAYFQFTLPEEGLTLKLEVQTGLVILYASNKIQNPNEAFYDWKLETSSSADVYISPDDLEVSPSLTKRQVLQSLNTTIFISIEGQSGTNNFTTQPMVTLLNQQLHHLLNQQLHIFRYII